MPPPLKRKKLNNSGILSNSYIPPLTAIQLERELQKLPPDSLYSLTHLWLSITATQPIPDENQKKQGFSKDSLSKLYLKKLEKFKTIKSKVNLKKKLINILLVEFYPGGLNTLQLAQIDVQLIVDKPNSNLWVSSTAKIVNKTSDIPNNNEENNHICQDKLNKLTNYTFSLDSQLFLDTFISNLSNLFLTHVYISRHPYYPLILIRVQMYNFSHCKPKDNNINNNILSNLTNDSLDKIAKLKFENDFQRIINNKKDKNLLNNNKFINNGFQRQIQIQNKPQIIPHKPFYILLPISSPHIIHTPEFSEDISMRLILQTLETTLSYSNQFKNNLKNNNKNLFKNSTILNDTKIKIFLDSDISSPIRNLNTIFTLKGISRFSSSIGSWAPYANDLVDISIFGDENKHQIIQPEIYIDLTDDFEIDKESDMKRVASLKFKGSVFKKMKSIEILEGNDNNDNNNNNNHNHDVSSIEEINEFNSTGIESKQDLNSNLNLKDSFDSIIPIHECKFQIKDDLIEFFKNRKNKDKKNKSSFNKLLNNNSLFKFNLDLYGSDVFGGLHELASKGIVDPYNVPDWLTGESGYIGGVINKGKMYRKK